jgi:hypothetical protein
MKKAILLVLAILITFISAQGQMKFRSGTFFHHSTGLCIWGPNGSSTSVPQQMTSYNTSHGYTGTNAVTLTELWFPAEDDNEWCRWHLIFLNQDTTANIQPYYSGNRIMVVKSCFPSSNIEAYGEPGDTAYFDYKTVCNYKWHWRNIIKVMKSHPQNFFVIWTNASLVLSQTTTQEAFWAHCFCKWAKDTLANGLDPVFGAFPSNVYVFDFFHKLVNSSYMLNPAYATGLDNSHPNAAATTLVAPQFVNEIFNAAINYESHYSIKKISEIVPDKYKLHQNYPNPFNPNTNIRFSISESGKWKNENGLVTIKVYDASGKETATLVNENLQTGEYEVTFDGSNLPSGVYFYKLQVGDFTEIKKMVLIK